jgi:hypothetical protein
LIWIYMNIKLGYVHIKTDFLQHLEWNYTYKPVQVLQVNQRAKDGSLLWSPKFEILEVYQNPLTLVLIGKLLSFIMVPLPIDSARFWANISFFLNSLKIASVLQELNISE